MTAFDVALYQELRESIVEFARAMVSDRLVRGTSGNISRRLGDVVAVTPGAVEYAEMTPDDVPLLSLDGTRLAGERNSSSETPLHLEIYRRQDVQAIVHTHSTFAAVVSVTRSELPSVHYMTASMGGVVPVVPYSRYGSAELAAAVSSALDGRSAVIMRNHGAVTTGSTLRQAYNRNLNLEWMCEVYVHAQQLGPLHLLDDEEIAHVADRMTTRGYLDPTAQSPEST